MATPVAFVARQREARGHIVELAGPAGAGKSTLARLLCRRQRALRRRLTAWDLPPFMLATHGVRELPLLFGTGRLPQEVHFRCFSDLTRIVALCARLRQADLRACPVVLLDEGPIFLLTRVLTYVPNTRPWAAVRERWLEALRQCAANIDRIFWVDAPDHLLADRIRRRAKAHRVKHASDAEIADFCTKYRAAFVEVSALFAQRGGPEVTCFTAGEPLARVTERMEYALRSSRVD